MLIKQYFIPTLKNQTSIVHIMQFYFSIFLLIVLTFFALLLDAPQLGSLIQTF